ncbi:MAG: DNA mismatch repair endonuclease MutL [Planctomycetota bacterium]
MTALSTQTPRIRALSPLVASQIAAGEVVERPASVVKELVENSIDAGATRIVVELEQGGIELVRVTDDGGGIVREDLALAVMPHATSKITGTEDLDRIATLGFRGEALASITSVSRFSIRSRTATSDAAWQLDTDGVVEGLGEHSLRPASGPVGTSITVRNLFFNTPARRKFLRTVATEQSRCVDTLAELALAHPTVSFVCKCEGRTLLDTPMGQSPHDRALEVLGKELKGQLLTANADQFDDPRGIALWGLIGLPSIARATRGAQHVFINGRAVRDKTVQHALAEAYRGIIEPGRHATALLMLEMSPQAVDVNVHPTKAEVRFRDSGVVHSTVYHACKRALAAADLTPTYGSMRPGALFRAGEGRAILPSVGPAAQPAYAPTSHPTSPAAFIEYFKRIAPSNTQTPISYQAIREAVEGTQGAAGPGDMRPESVGNDGAASVAPGEPSLARRALNDEILLDASPAQRILQVHNSFVVTQDEQGVLIVDQHALHERVMFEALLARVGESDLESQRLLTPVVVDASPAQLAKLDELAPLLKRIGVEAEPFGPSRVAVQAFPTFLFDRGVDPAEFLTDLFEKSSAGDFMPGSEDALRDVLDMMSCKAAVKAGDRMNETELTELLKLREAVERSSNCPHGRPTTVRLTIRELERLFGRS